MSFKEYAATAMSKVEAACSAYARLTDAAEEKIMHACGSDRTMDEVVEDYTSRGWTSVKKCSGVAVEKTVIVAKKVKEKAPMIKLGKKTTQQVLDDLAQDKDLAAALRYVYMHPCIKVKVTEIHDEPVKGINCDGKAPMVRTGGHNNGALKAGVCDGGKAPAPISMVSRMNSFMGKVASTKLVTVN